MKKIFFLSLLALVMASCTNDELVSGNSGNDDATLDQASSFLTIKMRTANAINMTRANEGNDLTGDDNSTSGDATTTPPEYENGTADENAVTRVRFFFFDENGNACGVHHNSASDTYNSFIDWYPTDGDVPNPYPGENGQDNPANPGDNTSVVPGNSGNPGKTVEKVLTATLGLNMKEANSQPAKVMAIINPTAKVLNLPNATNNADNVNGPSLPQLQDVVEDYLTGLTQNNFVMSNSVYLDANKEIANKEIRYTTVIDNKSIALTPEVAAENPVTIYVERVLARLDLGFEDDFFEKEDNKTIDGEQLPIFKATSLKKRDVEDDGKVTEGGEEDIYVKFLGWNVTRTANMSRLVKEINEMWEDESVLGAEPWNTKDYRRSFWAINPDKKKNTAFDYQYGTFEEPKNNDVDNNVNIAQALELPIEKGEFTTTYLQENAAPCSEPNAAPEACSQVIIAAQLVDENGKKVDLAQWGYNYYTLEGLKRQLANVLGQLYMVNTTTGQEKYTRIEPKHIDFQYEDPANANNEKNYYVYAVLSDEASKATWQLGNAEGTEAFAKAEDVNKYIRDMVNHAMIWKDGYTYYFFPIKHLGEAGTSGETGVVRNHIYRCKIKSVAGLGVPVYEPDQIIIPEDPGKDDAIIDAEIRILQWRVVEQGYDLVWE